MSLTEYQKAKAVRAKAFVAKATTIYGTRAWKKMLEADLEAEGVATAYKTIGRWSKGTTMPPAWLDPILDRVKKKRLQELRSVL